VSLFGDLAEARDPSGGALWQPRDWLVNTDDELYEVSLLQASY
jgi:hypothetical protein